MPGCFVGLPWRLPMVQAKPEIAELDMGELDDVLRRAKAALDAKDYETIRKVIGAYEYLVALVGDKETSLRRLRQMLFGAKTEKTAAVIGGLKGVEKASPEAAAVDSPTAGEGEACVKVNAETTAETAGESHSSASDEASPGPSGHGHNGADAYTGAKKIEVRRESLQPGDPCPKCEVGTLYDTCRPGVLVRLVGQPPVGATIYYLQKLRCGLCGVVFTADPPAGVRRGEVRSHSREHDCPAEIWKRDAFPPRGASPREPGHSLCRPRPSGTSWTPRPSVRSRSSGNWSKRRPKETWFTMTTPASRFWR